MAAMLDTPLGSLEAWTEHLAGADIPVLRRSARALQELQKRADSASAREVAAVILRDPLLTARLLATFATRRSGRQVTDITTIDRIVVMMGMVPFFNAFCGIPVVEERLEQHPRAMLGLLKVLKRATRAADYAFQWALHRQDLEVEEITITALLHDLSEMLMWCFAPSLALELQGLHEKLPRSRTREHQKLVLGIQLIDLQLALSRRWRLPELLVAMMEERRADDPRVRNVSCAVDLARHSANGWEDPALPDDYARIAELLRMKPEQARAMVEPQPPAAASAA